MVGKLANYIGPIPTLEEVKRFHEVEKLYGPYIDSKTQRRFMGLCINGKLKRNISVGRLNLEVKLGRKLLNYEEADHIDEDKYNDNPNNLQILSKVDNVSKSRKNNTVRRDIGYKIIDFNCDYCRLPFKIKESQLRWKLKVAKFGVFCSTSCSNKGRKR